MTRKLHDRHQRTATGDPSMLLTGEDAANPQDHEMRSKMTELSRSDNDISNLLVDTGVASMFVNFQLCILRYSPAAVETINLTPSALGRPLDHIVSNLIGCNLFSLSCSTLINKQGKQYASTTTERANQGDDT